MIKKISQIKKAILLSFVILFWLCLFSFAIISIYLNRAQKINKKSIVAGYSSGSIIDYRLMIYEDSTYYLSTVNSLLSYRSKNRWYVKNDTILLKRNGKASAKLLG